MRHINEYMIITCTLFRFAIYCSIFGICPMYGYLDYTFGNRISIITNYLISIEFSLAQLANYVLDSFNWQNNYSLHMQTGREK